MSFRKNNDFEGFSLSGWIRERILRVRRSISEMLGQDEFRGNPEGSSWGQRLLLPLYLLWAFVIFLFTGWSTTRRSKPFVGALPALAVAAGYIGLLVIAYNAPFSVGPISLPDPASKVLASLLTLRQTAEEEKDADEKSKFLRGSLTCAEHLVALRPTDKEAKFQLGLARGEVGDELGARSVFSFLAPLDDSTGYSRAHLWMANDLMPQAVTPETAPDPVRNALALEHLKKVEEAPENDETAIETFMAQNRIAALLANEGKKEEAIEILRRSVAGKLYNTLQLRAIVMLCQLMKETGQTAGLDSFTNQALQQCHELSIGLPDNFDIWNTILQLYILKEDYIGARKTLKDGIAATSSPEVKELLNKNQTGLYLYESSRVPDIDSRENYIRRLLILGNGLQVNPRSAEFYFAIRPFLDTERNRPEEETWLREAFLSPDAPSMALDAIIGTREMLSGKFTEGQKRWMTAFRSNPAAIIVINNILFSLSEEKPERAENLANLATVAIESFPDQAVLYYTRARLLNQTNKIEQAIQDLEKLMVMVEDALEPRELLAEILEKRGETERVATLRKEALAIREKRDQREAELGSRSLRQQ